MKTPNLDTLTTAQLTALAVRIDAAIARKTAAGSSRPARIVLWSDPIENARANAAKIRRFSRRKTT